MNTMGVTKEDSDDEDVEFDEREDDALAELSGRGGCGVAAAGQSCFKNEGCNSNTTMLRAPFKALAICAVEGTFSATKITRKKARCCDDGRISLCFLLPMTFCTAAK